MDTFPFDAAILAGGKSSRMGKDKALMPFGRYPSLAYYQYTRLKEMFEHVYLSAKNDKFDFKAPVLPDRNEIYSPMAALASILETLQPETLFVLGVDMPSVDRDVIAKLHDALKQEKNAVAVWAQSGATLHPLCAIYTSATLPLLHTLLNEQNHTLRALKARAKIVTVQIDEEKLTNLNTPEAFEAAAKALR